MVQKKPCGTLVENENSNYLGGLPLRLPCLLIKSKSVWWAIELEKKNKKPARRSRRLKLKCIQKIGSNTSDHFCCNLPYQTGNIFWTPNAYIHFSGGRGVATGKNQDVKYTIYLSVLRRSAPTVAARRSGTRVLKQQVIFQFCTTSKSGYISDSFAKDSLHITITTNYSNRRKISLTFLKMAYLNLERNTYSRHW